MKAPQNPTKQNQQGIMSRTASKLIINDERRKSISTRYYQYSYQIEFKDRLIKFIEHPAFKTYSIILTLFALFSDDIKFLTTTKDYDNLFNIIIIVVISLFSLEMILYFIVDETYGCGLFFWIDIMGITSMILDITTISNQIVYGNGDQNGIFQVHQTKNSFLKLSKSLKIIRIVRITKLVKMFNHLFTKKTNKDKGNISSKFEDFSSQKMILLILLLLIAVIAFNPNYYYSTGSDIQYGIQLFNDLPKQGVSDNDSGNGVNLLKFSFDFYLKEFINNNKTPLIYCRVYKHEYLDNAFDSVLRMPERLAFYDDCPYEDFTHIEINTTHLDYLIGLHVIPLEKDLNNKCISIFDNRASVHLSSKLNIIKTTAILFIFVIGFVLFSFDVEKLVLNPIENMTIKIGNMAKNPISSMDDNSKDANPHNTTCLSCKSNVELLETKILEKKISKICAMLALGFGEAGSQIISSVLQEGVNVEMNPIIPGKKVMGIYGFCDIRNFTDTTEVLQEKVMIFVNQVAEIVHQIVSDYCGSANKNIGDAFLLVWKFEERFITIGKEGQLTLRNCREVNQICDMALISFILILIEVQKSYKLSLYKTHEKLNMRMKNYSVKMGFGLHLGYSIEGAIGSMFKIDASYLSPNVNMANGLEEKTKEFGKELIISGSFVDYLSPNGRKALRLLDQIRNATGEIVRYYTIDLNLSAIPVENEKDSQFCNDDIQNKLERIQEKRRLSKALYNEVVNNKIDVWSQFKKNLDFSLCRKKYSELFFELYEEGMNEYIKGNWEEAKEKLNNAKKELNDKDVPIENILNYMQSINNIAPDDWKGCKEH